MTRLGSKQLKHLSTYGSYGRFLVVPDKMTYSLVKRGLMEFCAADRDGFAHITPLGLRVLADEIDAGRVPNALACLEKMKRKLKP